MASQTVARSLRDEIAAANEQFMAAFGRGDAAALTACYTPDAQLLPANSDVVEGHASIEQFWRGAMGAGLSGARLETVEAAGADDAAYEVGRYTLSAGGQVADRGKYVVIWRRHGGQWRLHRDIWTTSLPAAS